VLLAILKVARRKVEGELSLRRKQLMYIPPFHILFEVNQQILLSMVLKVPDAHLDEYLKEIEIRCGVTVSKGRLSDILSDLSITRKKV
jgi:hypothetical protein